MIIKAVKIIRNTHSCMRCIYNGTSNCPKDRKTGLLVCSLEDKKLPRDEAAIYIEEVE